MYRTILVPLDGSKRAEMIRPHVRELAGRLQATVILLTVVEPVFADGIGESYMGISEKAFNAKLQANQAYLDGVAAKIREKGIACTTRVSHGPVVETIIDVAESEAADIIAMTSHGRGGLSRLFYGSVAAGILNRVDRPLFIIRARMDDLMK